MDDGRKVAHCAEIHMLNGIDPKSVQIGKCDPELVDIAERVERRGRLVSLNPVIA